MTPQQSTSPHSDKEGDESRIQEKKMKTMLQRRRSAHSVIRRALNKTRAQNRFDVSVERCPWSISQTRGEESQGSFFVMEEHVHLTRGQQTQERHLFLFTDLLLIAKSKSLSSLKLKAHVRLSELWLASCIDLVTERKLSSKNSFVIGWPTTNYVVTLSSLEAKEKWLSALQWYISQSKHAELPSKIATRLMLLDDDVTTTTVQVDNTATAEKVLQTVTAQHGLRGPPEEWQLWVETAGCETAFPLIGHEIPYNIILHHLRASEAQPHPVNNNLLTAEGTLHMELLPRDLPVPRFFIRARTLKHPLAAADISQKNRRKRSILKWPLRRGPNSNSSSLGGSTHTPLFGQPLSSICSHGNLPQVIMDMLCLLYREGPDTQGIFRRSANAKNCRLLKEKLNAGLCALPDGESVFVAASIFTDFLRHLPGSILGCHLYKKWMEVMEKKEEEQKDLITSLLAQLPEGNTLLLRYVFWLLYRIQACSQENQMSASNLALCIAPNMLWLPEPSRPEEEGQATRKVAALVELLIENTPSIFGEDVGSLLSERKTSREECEASGDPFPQLCSSDEADAEPTLYRTKNLSSSSLVSSDPFFPPLATLSLRDKGDFPASSASSVSVCSLPGRVPCLSPSRDRCSSEPTVCPLTPHAIIGRQLSCDAAVMCNASHQSQTLSSKTPRLQIHHALRGDASPRAGAGRHYTLWRSPPIPQRFRHAARRLPSMSSLSSTATSSLSSLDSALSLTSSEPLSSPNDTVPRPFLFGAAARLRPLTPDTPRKFPPEWSMAFPYKENEDGGAVEGERDPEIEEEAEDGVILVDKAEKCQGNVTKDVTERDSGENYSLNCSDKGMGGVIFTVRPGGPLKENGAQVACREESQQGERTPTGVTCQPRETSVAHIHLSHSNTLAHAHLHTLPPTADAEGRSRTKITLYASSGTLQVKQPAVQMAAKEDGRSLVATETAGSHTVRLWIPQTVFYGQSAPLILRSAPAREPAHPITHSTSIAKADTELVVPGEGTNYGEDDNKGVPEGVTLGLPQSKRASTLISPKPQGIHHTIRIRLPGRVRNTVREYFSHGERRSSHPATVEREFVVRKLHWKRKTPHGAAAEDSAVTPDGDESVV